MRISSIQLTRDVDGLSAFVKNGQEFKIKISGNVILAGKNGSGKTRFLKLFARHIQCLKEGHDDSGLVLEMKSGEDDEMVTVENARGIFVANYSHYDAQFQFPYNFTPYVVSEAKNILRKCDYKETALNALLFIEDMAREYSKEYKNSNAFTDFSSYLKDKVNLDISIDETTRELVICGSRMRDLKEKKAFLSPGQQYLLRIAVACYCNEVNDDLLFILDEPELHLHPQALIELIETLRLKFPEAQLWISTHSLALISYLTVVDFSTTVLCLENGKITELRSDSTELLNGLVGGKENQFAIRQLFALPFEYTCNKFAAECNSPPDTLSASGHDPQTSMIQLCEGNLVLDFGAGKGRFFEELAWINADLASKITYFAYDVSNEHSEKCKRIMNKYGSTDRNYYNDWNSVVKVIGKKADYVLLVNVLHEINPIDWKDVFNKIQQVLKESGKLIIVERDELTVGETPLNGETPYDSGYYVLTEGGAKILFGAEHCAVERHRSRKKIVKYLVDSEGLNVDDSQVVDCIKEIRNNSYQIIKQIKSSVKPVGIDTRDDKTKFNDGISLAFHSHQYTNAALWLDERGL